MCDFLVKEKPKSQFVFSNIRFIDIPPVTSTKPTKLKYKSTGSLEWGNKVSANEISSVLVLKSYNEEFVAAFLKRYEAVVGHVRGEISNELGSSDSLASIIAGEEERLQDRIAALAEVLDNVVCPDNRPTKAMQDYHGATFSLRGFIRFICTNGQYKKIYENVIGHPRKDYKVSVILDTSSSMEGMTAVGSLETFIVMAASLSNTGIEFNLMTSAAHTNLVKSFDEEWGDVSKTRAYYAIHFKEQESNIADSIMYATQLLQEESSMKTVKMMIVITDGYASAPGRLRMSLAFAEDQGVVVVGVGVGFFTDPVRSFFPKNVILTHPKLVAAGLKNLFSGEGHRNLNSLESGGIHKKYIEEEKEVRYGGRVLTSVEEIWNEEMKDVYQNEVERTQKALYFTVSSVLNRCGTFSAEVCFVMDTTGSMTPHIENAKTYTIEMANKIKATISSCGKTADLKFGFVSYRFFGNELHKANHPLSENLDSVVSFIRTMTPGGGHGEEDKCGGLQVALGMTWTTRAKFIVLIGDIEDHMMVCAGCKYCYGSRYPGGISGIAKEIARQGIYLLYVRITQRTDKEEIIMKQNYNKAASSEMKMNGFRAVDITAGNGSEILMSKVTEGVENVLLWDFM